MEFDFFFLFWFFGALGVASFLGKRSMSFSGIDVCEEANGEDDLSDDGSQAGEKKRRLNMEQVKTLEKNFELGNKLEPERKMQLARALGLQPRQIAIWFQNRRARWKTKQLEKDYDLLKRQYEAIKANNDVLQAQNQKLHAEVILTNEKNKFQYKYFFINSPFCFFFFLSSRFFYVKKNFKSFYCINRVCTAE